MFADLQGRRESQLVARTGDEIVEIGEAAAEGVRGDGAGCEEAARRGGGPLGAFGVAASSQLPGRPESREVVAMRPTLPSDGAALVLIANLPAQESAIAVIGIAASGLGPSADAFRSPSLRDIGPRTRVRRAVLMSEGSGESTDCLALGQVSRSASPRSSAPGRGQLSEADRDRVAEDQAAPPA